MSIKVSVYTPDLSQEFLPQICSRFGKQDMDCQFDPGFTLDPISDSGMVSLRLRVTGSAISQYENVDMLSRFEVSFKDFRYSAPVSVIPAINESLKRCSKQVIIRMHATPTNSLRAGMYFAIFLAEVADGIVYIPRSDQYIDAKQALSELAEHVRRYELDLPQEDWNIMLFEAWAKR